ncbi:hypothetical protein HK096_010495, partial [Nowakowskiella sp. JEL0078]
MQSVMQACIILHNMIAEDKEEEVDLDIGYLFDEVEMNIVERREEERTELEKL